MATRTLDSFFGVKCKADAKPENREKVRQKIDENNKENVVPVGTPRKPDAWQQGKIVSMVGKKLRKTVKFVHCVHCVGCQIEPIQWQPLDPQTCKFLRFRVIKVQGIICFQSKRRELKIKGRLYNILLIQLPTKKLKMTLAKMRRSTQFIALQNMDNH